MDICLSSMCSALFGPKVSKNAFLTRSTFAYICLRTFAQHVESRPSSCIRVFHDMTFRRVPVCHADSVKRQTRHRKLMRVMGLRRQGFVSWILITITEHNGEMAETVSLPIHAQDGSTENLHLQRHGDRAAFTRIFRNHFFIRVSRLSSNLR